jgi:hypothetical protein
MHGSRSHHGRGLPCVSCPYPLGVDTEPPFSWFLTFSALCFAAPSLCRARSPSPWTTEPSSWRRSCSHCCALPLPKLTIAPSSSLHAAPQCPFVDLPSASTLLEVGHRRRAWLGRHVPSPGHLRPLAGACEAPSAPSPLSCRWRAPSGQHREPLMTSLL